MVPFFKWSPAVLLVRDLLIHLIFEGDDKTINKYLRISPTSEPKSEEKPKKGFFKSLGETMFGSSSSKGFESELFTSDKESEGTVSTVNPELTKQTESQPKTASIGQASPSIAQVNSESPNLEPTGSQDLASTQSATGPGNISSTNLS